MKDRMMFEMFIDPAEPNVLLIRPKYQEWEAGKIYKMNLKEIPLEHNSQLPSQEIEYITKPNPFYIRVEDVMSIVDGLPLDRKKVIFHIREACRELDFRVHYFNDMQPNGREKSQGFTEESVLLPENYPVYMFLRYMAAYNCILDYYVKLAANPQNVKDQVADLIREEKLSLRWLKDLLDKLKDEADDWLNLVLALYAAPTSAIRSRNTAYHNKVWKPEYALSQFNPRNNFDRRF